MIYKIQFELTESFPTVLDKLKSMGELILFNNIIYVDSQQDKTDILTTLKSLIIDNEQIMISEVLKENFISQPKNVLSWIKDIQIKEEKRKFEVQQAKALDDYNKFIDAIEIELEKQLSARKEEINIEEEKTTESESKSSDTVTC